MGHEGTANRFRTFAMSEGMDGSDPLLADAVEALRKLERGEFGPHEDGEFSTRKYCSYDAESSLMSFVHN
jgi:hypothetical protein